MTALGLAAALPFNQTKGDPLLALGPVFAIRAKDSVEGEQWALNKGTGGQVLRARYGSVGRAEIRRGVGLVLPGATGNNASIATSPQATTSLSIRCELTLDSWIPAVQNNPLAKWGTGAGDRQFLFGIDNSTGRLVLYLSTDGSTTASVSASTVSPTPMASGRLGLRADWDVSGTVKFYTKDCNGLLSELVSDSNWVQLGSDRTGAASTALWASTTQLRFGSHSGSSYTSGILHTSHVRVNGTTIASVDFTNQPDLTTSFTCTTGQTVTVTAVNAVDSADPTLLTAGENYVYLPGTASNTVTTTHAANQNPSGNLNFSARVMMYDWTPSASSLIYHKHNGSSTGFYVQVLTDGRLLFVWGDGVGTVIWATNAAMPFTNGVWYWINITLNLSTGIPTFSWALDSRSEPSSWTNVASSYSSGTAGTTTIAADTVTGPQFGAANGEMALKRIIVRGGSTTNVDVDFTQNTDQSSFVCATGHTITISRASSGRKTVVVTKPVWLLGTDDYLEVSDNDLLDIGSTDSVTILFVFRNWLPVSGSIPISKATTNSASAAEKRWTFRYTTANNLGFILDDGTAVESQWLKSTDGTLTVAAASIDLSNVYNKVGVNYSTTARTPSDARNSLIMSIGTNSGGIAYFDGEIYAVYIYRKALTAAEIAAGVQYWNAA